MDSFNNSDSSILSGSDGSEFGDRSPSQSDSSLCSESNCFSHQTTEPSHTNISVGKPKRHLNLLDKLYFREIRGNFTSHPRAPNLKLFNSVPAENIVRLQHVLPESAFHSNHVFLGLSKCGQFLLSYTHSVELDVIIFNNVHKYRLHWWSFVPHQRARKVAEVMLFGKQVYCDLHISVCQWPTDISKLLVYGYCVHTDHCQFGHSHMTITTVPSLNKCPDCLLVAASYEEDDLAAIWDSCVRFSCLKHGLTIHTNFDVVSPHPKFDPQISMKRDGVVFFNTGNFLHVLRADLEQFGSVPAREVRVSGAGAASALENPGGAKVERPVDMLGEFLENCGPTSGGAELSPESRDRAARIDRLRINIDEGRREGERMREDLGSRFWFTGASRSPCATVAGEPGPCRDAAACACERTARREALTQRERAVKDFKNEVFRGRPEAENASEGREGPNLKRLKTSPDGGEDSGDGHATPEVAPCEIYINRSMGETFDASMELNIVCGSGEEPSKVSLKSSTRSLLVVSPRDGKDPPTSNGERKCRKSRAGPVKIGSPSPAPAETVYEFTDDPPDRSEKLSSFRRRRLAEKKYEFCEEGEDAENIVPFRLLRTPRLVCRRCTHEDAGDAPADPRSPDAQAAGVGDQDKTVLRPLNRNLVAITLLSPREADRDWAKIGVKKVTGEALVSDIQKAGRDDAPPLGQGVNSQARCTIQFKTRYIEVDDELMSTTTEIDDDDDTGSTPYHLAALPLDIHGAGYVQLQMISKSKAEKLMGAPGVVVHQMSFDVEAFCHEVAQRLCEAAAKKYCFCMDYDVEIIDVCLLTGDVLVLAIMRIEAIVVSKGLTKSLRRGEILVGGQRNQYQGSCTFVWNTDTGVHKIVHTSALVESSISDVLGSREPWAPAKSYVRVLRRDLSQVPMCSTVRSITNQSVFTDDSYKCLLDLDNLIELVL